MIKTAILMAVLMALMSFIGGYFGGQQGMMMMLIISLGINLYAYWNSDKMVLNQYNAKEVTASTHPNLYAIVRNLAQKAHLPMPKVYVIASEAPNAFATGRNAEHAAVAVTNGLMRNLSADEIAGVLGHELTHVKNNDILISTVAGCLAGAISSICQFAAWFGGGSRDNENHNPIVTILLLILAPLAATIIQLSISRSREYLADEGGAELCGNPRHLANALLKIERIAHYNALPNASQSTAHLFIINPFKDVDFSSLFSTHPSTQERVAKLEQKAMAMGIEG